MPERDREPDLARNIGRKVERRLRSGSAGRGALWYGLGSFGIVGWSVAIPTLIGIAVGVWLDRILADRVSWTLMGLFAGVTIGCVIAWLWLRRAADGGSP